MLSNGGGNAFYCTLSVKVSIINITMKDLALSLLSRGYSKEIQTHGGGPYRRLEVFFEPEDYFNWRSQPSLLRLTSSGRLLGGVEPAPPKTYSTRKGPLILYSEDLALSSCQTNKVNRKGRPSRTSREETEIQLHTLQDLTEAILAYGKKQISSVMKSRLLQMIHCADLAEVDTRWLAEREVGHKLEKSHAKVGCHTSVTQPLPPVLKHATLRFYSQHWPTEEQDHVTQLTGRGDLANSVYPRPGQVRYQPRFLCFPQPHRPPSGPLPPITQSLAPRHSEDRPHLAPDGSVSYKTKGPKKQDIHKDTKMTFRTAVGTQRVQMSPIPEAETGAREKLRGWTVEETVTEHLTDYPKDESGQWKQSAIETGGEKEYSSLKPANINPSLGCSHLSSVNNFRRHVEGACQQGTEKQRATNTHLRNANTHKPSFNTFHLPPINQAFLLDSDIKDHEVKCTDNTTDNHNASIPQLPDIHHPDMNTETGAPKSPERCVLRKVLLLLPSQINQDGHNGLPEDGKEREDGLPEKKEETEDVLCRGVDQKVDLLMRGGPNPDQNPTDQYNLIWFEPVEDKENQTIPGPLPPFIGRKGPGKQSSMALYRQDPGQTADQTETRSGIIRGSLPLELRECEKGEHCGTLIMGPAGEIICLSLWDTQTDIEDHPVLDEATTEHEQINKGELEAQPGHRQHASFNQEKRLTAEHSKAVKKAECYDGDGKRTVKVQACAPEQRAGKLKRSTDNQPAYRTGEITEIKSSGRTHALQPEGGDTPGSSIPNSTSASSPQKKAHSTSTAVQESLHKGKLKIQTNIKPETTFDSKTQSRKASGGDDAESTQIRKVGKKGEVDQDVRGVIENKHEDKKTRQTNTYTESEDTVYTADPTPEPTLEKKKTTAVGEKPKKISSLPGESRSQPTEHKYHTKESLNQLKETRSQLKETRSQLKETRSQPKENRSQPKESRSQPNESRGQVKESTGQPNKTKSQPKEFETEPDESTKPPNSTKKLKKKNKSQTAFVVGKPRESRAEREADNLEKQFPSTEENNPEYQAEHDHCCSAHGPSVDIDQASVHKEDYTAAGSPRTHSSTAVSYRSLGSAAASSRSHDSVLASTRKHSSAAVSTRTHSPAAYSYRTHSPAATSIRTHSSSSYSYRTHSPTVASTRTNSSTALYAAREKPWRTSKAAKTEACSPAPLSLIQMPSQSAVPAQHSSSNPAKSGSSGHAQNPDEAAALRESKAAALAEKAERRRLEVERKRKEKEEEQRREEEREEREERMRLELEEEKRQRAELARLKKLKEEEDRQKQEDREMERQKRERAEMERERRRQEEKRRLLERLQRERQEEEKRRAAELKRQQQEEEAQREMERIRLQEMDESERIEYLRRRKEEEEEKRRIAEQRRIVEEEAARQAVEEARLMAELFERQRAVLEQQLNFSRSLLVESEGLEQTQDISRPWVFSYFSLMKLLGLVEPQEKLVEEVL